MSELSISGPDRSQLRGRNGLSRRDEPMSRRKFLQTLESTAKGAFGVAAVVAVEQVAHPIQGFIDWVAQGNLGEYGSPHQVAAGFERVTVAYSQSRSSEDLQTLIAWLKFNGALNYGKAKGLVLSPYLLNHFLYAKGEQVDITDYYRSAILTKFNEGVLSSVNDSGQSSESAQFSEAIGNLVGLTDLGDASVLKYPGSQQNITHARDLPNRVIKSLTVIGPMDDDIYFGLNNHTIGIQGLCTSVNPANYKNPEGLTPTEITFGKRWSMFFRDRYDWSQVKIRTKVSLMDQGVNALEKVGVTGARNTLVNLIGEDNFETASRSSAIETTDSDGALLARKGFAKDFGIEGKFNSIDAPLRIKYNLDLN